MNKKQSKRQRDIKTKLMAAICMLLVSSIMMVSTTYAWFTLSTAPEVTGINTAVGANGNLEMALQRPDGDSSKITSGTGDSMSVTATKVANITWGNLVDVSDTATYGLDKVMLYPAALNAAGGVIAAKPLSTPAYGADGRVSALESKTITGVYNSNESKFLEGYTGSIGTENFSVSKAYGVRAIGVSSGMSDRQLAYRDAVQVANTSAEKAKSVASKALEAKGAALADIAIEHATTDGDTDTYSVADLNNLMAIVDALLGTDDTAVDGSLEYIEQAMVQYALATALGNTTGITDDNYADVVTAFASADITATTDTLSTTMTTYGVSISAVTSVIDELQTSLTNVESAKTTLQDLLNGAASDATFSWNQISPALYMLANPDSMQVNGIAVKDLKGSWLYDAANDGITEAELEAEGRWVGTDGYVYEKDDDGNDAKVSNMGRLVDAVLNDGLQLIIKSGAGVFADIADFCGDYSAGVTLSKISYGGMTVKNLDATMSTKTSQTTPYLTAAKNAVPAFSAGSSTAASAAISDFYGYIIDLAFRTNATGSSLKLQGEAIDRIYTDGKNEATMGHGATMSFKSDSATFSIAQLKELMASIRVVFFNTDDNKIIGYARLNKNTAETAADGTVTMTLVMYDETAGSFKDDQSIMELEQNTVHELSAMVYLDGASIGNDDVATGASSMTGTMNLQFSSTAQLTPMNYTDLKEGTGDTGAGDDDDESITLTNVTVNGATKGTAVYKGGYIAIQLTGVTEGSTATIQIGSEAAVSTTIVTQDGVTAITHAASDITADTAIVVTVTAPTT